jgi:hypothetical protein
MKQKNILRLAFATLTLLLIPLLAMPFTQDVDWDVFDFLLMGSLLFGTGLLWEFIRSRLQTTTQKVCASGALLILFLYVWAELGVGIFTSIGS